MRPARTTSERRNTLGSQLFSDGLRALASAVQLHYAHDDLGWDPAWTAELHTGAAGSRQSFAGALTDLAALLGGHGDTDIGKQPLAVITGIGAVTVQQSPPVALRALEQFGSVKLVAWPDRARRPSRDYLHAQLRDFVTTYENVALAGGDTELAVYTRRRTSRDLMRCWRVKRSR